MASLSASLSVRGSLAPEPDLPRNAPESSKLLLYGKKLQFTPVMGGQAAAAAVAAAALFAITTQERGTGFLKTGMMSTRVHCTVQYTLNSRECRAADTSFHEGG
jgi:hypothetical protein